MKSALIALLAFCLCWGVGCSKNLSEFEETKALAEKGVAAAQHNLGVMYADGEGVPQNFKEAVKWYRKAAEQGYEQAQYNLGIMHNKGDGVLPDYVTAYAWANIAEANGFDVKKFEGQLEMKMTSEQIAKAEELLIEMIKKNPKLLNE